MKIDMIRKGLLATVATGAFALGAMPVQAASISEIIAGGSFSFSFEDDAVEAINVDGGVAGKLEVGDTLRGIGRIQSIVNTSGSTDLGSGSGNNELTFIFETKVLTAVADAGNPGFSFFTFGPTGTLDNALGLGDGTQYDGLMAVFYEDASHDYTSAFGACTIGAGGTCEGNVTDGTAVLGLGFTGAGGAAAAGEIWKTGTVISSTSAPDFPGIITGASNATSLGQFYLNLGYLFNNLFNELPGTKAEGSGQVLGTCNPPDPAYPPTVCADANRVTQYTNTADFDISFQRIPEPASLGLLAIGLFGLGALARRRRAN